MADYACSPLWLPDGDGPVDPEEVGLPAALTAALHVWADAHDSTLDWDNAPAALPMRDAFLRPGEDERHSFEREGHRLWRELRSVLPDREISYRSVLLRRDVTPGSDELLDLLDDAGEVVGVLWRSQSRGVRHKRGVVGFLCNPAGEVFVPRRLESKAWWPGALDFSVGGLAMAGETPEEAFVREVQEELGLRLTEGGFQFLADFSPLSTSLQCFTRVYQVPFEGTPKLAPDEFSGGEWLLPSEVLDRMEAGERVNGDLAEVLRLLASPSNGQTA